MACTSYCIADCRNVTKVIKKVLLLSFFDFTLEKLGGSSEIEMARLRLLLAKVMERDEGRMRGTKR